MAANSRGNCKVYFAFFLLIFGFVIPAESEVFRPTDDTTSIFLSDTEVQTDAEIPTDPEIQTDPEVKTVPKVQTDSEVLIDPTVQPSESPHLESGKEDGYPFGHLRFSD